MAKSVLHYWSLDGSFPELNLSIIRLCSNTVVGSMLTNNYSETSFWEARSRVIKLLCNELTGFVFGI